MRASLTLASPPAKTVWGRLSPIESTTYDYLYFSIYLSLLFCFPFAFLLPLLIFSGQFPGGLAWPTQDQDHCVALCLKSMLCSRWLALARCKHAKIIGPTATFTGCARRRALFLSGVTRSARQRPAQLQLASMRVHCQTRTNRASKY